jgi:hypothetical protein
MREILMRLNFHARLEIGVVMVLLLGSCGGKTPRAFTDADYDRIDVADVNARNAIYQINELESRVDEIESRLRM